MGKQLQTLGQLFVTVSGMLNQAQGIVPVIEVMKKPKGNPVQQSSQQIPQALMNLVKMMQQPQQVLQPQQAPEIPPEKVKQIEELAGLVSQLKNEVQELRGTIDKLQKQLNREQKQKG